MIKIAIITITDGQNYGNRLQNYALQQAIKKTGNSCVETLKQKETDTIKHITSTTTIIKDVIKMVIGRKDTYFARRKRIKRFNSFNRKYIHFSKCKCTNVDGLSDSPYDLFVFGSDQIWNTRFSIIEDNIEFFLGCHLNDCNKIAFAASFGTEEIDNKYKNLFQNELLKFNYIGVREKEGKKIIKNLTGRNDVEVVVDPTMLLSKEEWSRVEKKPQGFTSNRYNYVFSYFLGTRSELQNRYLENICHENNLDLIDLEIEFKTDEQVRDKTVFTYTPDEFLWLIHNSKFVVTDSFHAVVFSIIFNKPFVVYSRRTQEIDNNIDSRLKSLLELFDLEGRLINPLEEPGIPKEYNHIVVNNILVEKREQSFSYLLRSIKK